MEKNKTNDFVFISAAKIVPKKTPITTNNPQVFIMLGSTELCFLCVKTETIDVGIIIEKEVPTAKCITYVLSIFNASNIKNKKGTVIKPPPIPNKPAKKPAIAATGTINIIK